MSDRTKITLAPALAASGIDHLADDLWDHLGDTYPAVVRLEVCERTEPSDAETDRKVKLRVVAIEIPQTQASRTKLDDMLRAMYAGRTGKDALPIDIGG